MTASAAYSCADTTDVAPVARSITTTSSGPLAVHASRVASIAIDVLDVGDESTVALDVPSVATLRTSWPSISTQ